MTGMKSDIADRLAQAIAQHAPLPVFPKALTLQEGYTLQQAVTQARTGGRIAGVKAGLTDPSIQALFGLDHALIGYLYADGALAPDCRLPHIPGRMLEVEAAVFVDEKGHPTAIAPAIEIVHLAFEVPTDMTPANLVACNLGADAFILGEPQPWTPELDTLAVTLSHDGKTVNQTDLSKALNGPAQAAAWMHGEICTRGLTAFPTDEEALYLTGACGTVVAAEPGVYEADYGVLGQLRFEIS